MALHVCTDSLYFTVSSFFQDVFESLGVRIDRHAKLLIPFCIVLTAVLSLGIVTMETETRTEVLYTPVNGRASQDRIIYKSTFPDTSGSYYVPYALTKEDLYGKLIISAVDGNLFSEETVVEIKTFISIFKSLNVTYNGDEISYSDVCARRNSECYVLGEGLVSDVFLSTYKAGLVTFPFWNRTSLEFILGDVNATNGLLVSANYMALTFYLRRDYVNSDRKAFMWEHAFLELVPNLRTKHTRINYAASSSLNTELDKNTSTDSKYFAGTFVLMVLYATVVAGGDVVSSRTWVSWAGIMAACFGIASSLGLLSLCGLKFVHIAAVMPFLIIGIGVDDMFLLISSWSDTQGVRPESRMGLTFRSAGVGITITSLTDLFAFVIGASSVFVSVRNFSIFTGVAVIFCYFYQCLFFGSCLALHGRRVDLTNSKLRSTNSRKNRKCTLSDCRITCCRKSISSSMEDKQEKSCNESLPVKYLPKILLNRYGYIIVLTVFVVYIGVSIWGITNFKQGLDLKNLVSPHSYYHTFSEVYENHFSAIAPIPFVFNATNFTDPDEAMKFESLLEEARLDVDVDNKSLACWYHVYKSTELFDTSSYRNFIDGLQLLLLFIPEFRNDVIFDSKNSTILASRCYLFSRNLKEMYVQAKLMIRMRHLVDTSPLPVYIFHPVHVYFDQYAAVFPSTIQSVGIVLVVMAIVTFMFLPNLTLILLVVLNIISILVGIFGFLHIWGLTLSAVTMIDLIMSVGFSVDFSVHVCSAYMLGAGDTRKEKVKAAITHAAGPILNGGMSSLLGVIVLAFSSSYISNSFFKIMFGVISFGMLHSVFLLPVVLCLVGPLVHLNPGAPSGIKEEGTGNGMKDLQDISREQVNHNGSNNANGSAQEQAKRDFKQGVNRSCREGMEADGMNNVSFIPDTDHTIKMNGVDNININIRNCLPLRPVENSVDINVGRERKDGEERSMGEHKEGSDRDGNASTHNVVITSERPTVILNIANTNNIFTDASTGDVRLVKFKYLPQ